MRKSNKVLAFLLVSVLSSCNVFSDRDKAGSESEVVARVQDQYLLKSDLEGLVTKGSAADSADITDRYIQSWIKKQLMLKEAASTIQFDEKEIERKMLDYRYALMVYEFEKDYIQREIDTAVTNEEIEKYYSENSDNFILKQNIIKGVFIKVPEGAPRIERLKNNLQQYKEKDKNEIKSYCFRFATNYYLEDSIWVNFDEVIKDTPLSSIPNKVQFLKENRFVETSDNNNVYLLKIMEYRISDQLSPLEFVSDQIKNIIINKRRVILADKLEEEIYNRASKNNDFEIYKKP